ncbi:MAG: DUF427 domain-containing protein [Candidatus Eiseniibacteriota bacterium]
MTEGHSVTFEPSPKRVRVMVNGKTVADSLNALLLFETGHQPVYYFPRQDVRADILKRTDHRTHCPFKGDASYWTLAVGDRQVENAVWGYEQPIEAATPIKGYLAFYWDRVDHWFEEDEEIFGHARDPHKRVDIIPSSRRVRVTVNGEVVADTRRALFLFETGLKTRYYVPPADVRTEFLRPSRTTTICPYKGKASYWSLEVGDKRIEDAIWFYPEPLPESARIKGYLCFYPEKVERLEVEGEPAKG